MTEGGNGEGRGVALTEEEPGWYVAFIEFVRKRERTAVLRRELAEARRIGKARRHAERLRKRGAA